MNIYKLNYGSKEIAKSTFVNRNVIDANNNYLNGTHAIVYLGYKVLLNILGIEIGQKHFYEVITTDNIDFGVMINLLGETPEHRFYGWD